MTKYQVTSSITFVDIIEANSKEEALEEANRRTIDETGLEADNQEIEVIE